MLINNEQKWVILGNSSICINVLSMYGKDKKGQRISSFPILEIHKYIPKFAKQMRGLCHLKILPIDHSNVQMTA